MGVRRRQRADAPRELPRWTRPEASPDARTNEEAIERKGRRKTGGADWRPVRMSMGKPSGATCGCGVSCSEAQARACQRALVQAKVMLQRLRPSGVCRRLVSARRSCQPIMKHAHQPQESGPAMWVRSAGPVEALRANPCVPGFRAATSRPIRPNTRHPRLTRAFS